MKKLDISISKAQLTGFDVSFSDKDVHVSATIALLTDQDKHITDLRIATNSWNKDTKFELPIKMHDPIKKIAAALEHVIVEHMRDGQMKLN